MPETLVFPGVRSARFIGYLHGLALLRVVSEQLDATARGAWSHGSFTLTTAVTREQLVSFFVDEWAPTPVVSPWNGGSGFHPKDKESRDALVAIEASEDPRLAGVRATVAVARVAVSRFGLDGPPDTKVKPAFVQHLRAVLPDAALAWLDASVVIAGAGVAFPPALGTGGNDGRFDLASNDAQCLVELFGLAGRRRDADFATLLDGLIDGTSVPKRAMSLGHLVRDVSPVGSPSGENAALANLWDLPLAIEGVVLLAAGASRRGESGSPAQAAAPFSVRPGAGYGSAVAGESARAEQWMPLWDAPATLAEVRSLLREGRASVGRRRASTGLDVARAAGELGVARGITAFERFGILERAGLSYVTLHAGTFEVRERPAAAALRGLDAGDWLSRVLAAGAEKPPTALRQAARSLEEAAFAMAARGDASDVERMLGRLGEMELVQARAGGRAASADGPSLRSIAPCAQPWLAALDLATPDVRVAMALGSLADGSHGPRLPPVRDLLNGTAIGRGERLYAESETPLVPAAGSAKRRLVALHLRREIDAAGAERHGPAFDFGLPVSLADLTLLATGQLDTERVLRLAAGLAVLDHRGCSVPPADGGGYVSPALATLALVVHHRSLGAATEADVWRVPRSLVARLASGAVVGVLRNALARLRQAGHLPIATAEDLVAAAPSGPGLALALLARPRVSDLHVALRRLTVPAPSSADDPVTQTEQESSS